MISPFLKILFNKFKPLLMWWRFLLKHPLSNLLNSKINKQFLVAGVIVNRTQQEIPNEATMKDTEDKAVSVVVEAARKLLA